MKQGEQVSEHSKWREMARTSFIERVYFIVYIFLMAFLITFYIVLQSKGHHTYEVNLIYYALCALFVLINLIMIIWFSKMAWYFIDAMAEAGDIGNPSRAKLLIILVDFIMSIGLYRLFVE